MKLSFKQAVVLCGSLLSAVSAYGFIDPVQLNKLPLDQRYQIKNMYSQIREELGNNGLSFDELIVRLNNGHYLDRVGLRLDSIKNRTFRQYILSLEQSIEQKLNQLRETLKDDALIRNAFVNWFNQENQAIARSFGGS